MDSAEEQHYSWVDAFHDYEIDDEPLYILPSGYRVQSASWSESEHYQNLQAIRQLINSHGLEGLSDSVTIKNLALKSGYVLVRDALFYDFRDVVFVLLNFVPEVNSNQQLDETPLHHAARRGYVDIAELLLSKGAVVNARNQNNETPLHKAAASNWIDVAELLVNHDADVNASLNDGSTSLHSAVTNGNEPLVELLLTKGANVNAQVRSTCVTSYSGLGLLPFDKITPLLLAAEYGHENIAKMLLEHGANVNDKRAKGETVLHLVVKTGCLSFVDLVLGYRPILIDERNLLKIVARLQSDQFEAVTDSLFRYGFTITFEESEDAEVLLSLIENNRLNLAEELLKGCRNVVSFVNKKSENGGYIPLHVACKHGRKEIVEMLINHGADVNAKDGRGNTALHYTPYLRDSKSDSGVEIAKLLLRSKADVDAKNSSGKTTLHLAVAEETDKIVEVLLDNDADVNAHYKVGKIIANPLLVSVMTDNVSITNLLLRKGADVNAKIDKTECRVIHFACFLGRDSFIESLLERLDLEVNQKAKGGKTPLHLAAKKCSVKNVVALLERGAGANIRDDDGGTPLHYATNRLGIVVALMAHGADVNSKNVKGKTPLHIAAETGMHVAVSALLKNGAEVDCRDGSGRTALHLATKSWCTETVSALLENGADIEVRDDSGKTPLYVAFEKANFDITFWCKPYVLALLNKGADVDARDDSGKTALHAACENRQPNGVAILLKHGADASIAASVFPCHTPLQCALERSSRQVVFNGACFGLSQLFLLDDFSETVALLRDNVIMMNSLNPFVVNKVDVDSIDFNDPTFHDFQTKCENEVALLKDAKLGSSNISLYGFLTSKRNEVARLSRNSGLLEILATKQYKDTFPIFSEMIARRFRTAQERLDLLPDATVCLGKVLPPLPDLCVVEISEHLSNRDLRKIIKACRTHLL